MVEIEAAFLESGAYKDQLASQFSVGYDSLAIRIRDTYPDVKVDDFPVVPKGEGAVSGK